jgi:hypothetical protein
MSKNFIIGWIVVFVAWMLGSFVIHGGLLQADYAQLSTLFRPEAEAEQYFPWMVLAHIMLAGSFVWIYSRGVEAAPWVGQGIRYGIAVALLAVVPMYLIYYAVQPMPFAVVVKQIIFDSVLVVILGLIVAFVYRQSAVVRTAAVR